MFLNRSPGHVLHGQHLKHAKGALRVGGVDSHDATGGGRALHERRLGEAGELELGRVARRAGEFEAAIDARVNLVGRSRRIQVHGVRDMPSGTKAIRQTGGGLLK